MGVATAVAIGGLALSAAGTTGSFIQGGKQRKAAAKAKDEAAKAMLEAKKELEINYLKGLSIQKEPYELQREALLSAGAQAIEAGREGETRGGAATAGRVQMAQQEGQAGVRTAMGQEMANLDKIIAAEDARLAGERANIDLEEAKGAQQAAAYATNAANQAMTQGFAGLQSMGEKAQSFINLYENQGEDTLGENRVTGDFSSKIFSNQRSPNLATSMQPRDVNLNPFSITRP